MKVFKRTRRAVLATSVGLLALGCGHAALAAAAADGTAVEEVVVTAQKKSENVQNVPQTVNVVGATQLQDFHVNQLTDIGAYVPGLQIDSSGTPGQTTISIRGVAPISSGTTVGTYIDETPIGSSSYHERTQSYALDILPYDVERLEVLQGPQGTLYGANSLGGLLKYVLVQPSLTTTSLRAGGELTGVKGAGSVGGGLRAMVNTPLVQDKLGFIASYGYANTPGYIDNARTGEKDQNGVRQESGRLALRWAAADNLTVRLGALFQSVNADGNATMALDPVTLKPLYGDLKDANYLPNIFRSRLQYYSGDINWDLGWASLVSATSYSSQRTHSIQDATVTFQPIYGLFGYPDGLSAFDLDLGNRKFTQEVRLQSAPGHKLEWLAGGFYDHETSTNHQIETATMPDGTPIAGLNPAFEGLLPITYNEYAFFGDLTYHFTDRFDVMGGVRYAHNSQDFRQTILPGPLLPPSDVPGHSSEGVWTYSVSPRFHVTDDIMTYVRVASGYQPGGPNTALPGVPPAVKSDTLTSYEVGLKSMFWDRRVTLNLAAYDLEWKDIQVVGSLPGGITYTTNGGTARSRGFQADGTIRPIQGLTVQGTLAYTDAKLTEDVPSVGGMAGDRLPYVPKWSGSLRADYAWPLMGEWEGHAGAGLRMVGDRFSLGPFAISQYKTPAYSALDLNLGVSNDRWNLSVFAKNVTDKRAYLTAGAIQDGLSGAIPLVEGAILQPRTIGVSLDVKM